MIHKYFPVKKDKELIFKELVFKKHIFNPETDISSRLFYFSFAEFGCESLIPTFLIPRINTGFNRYRKIVLGWSGREYFYRNVCDEFWELDEKFMALKNESYAFKNISREIIALNKRLSNLGIVINGDKMGNLCLNCRCQDCSEEFYRDRGDISCIKCGSNRVIKSLLQGCKEYKKSISPLSPIGDKYVEWANSIIPVKSVALFARNRKTYGRNLPENFYDKIIDLIISMGYNVVLLGEPISSYNIQSPKIINLFNTEYAGNLEAAFAAVNKCDFSIQFYTASTRISSLLDKPFILVESPDQLFGRGQEGRRLSLMTKNYSKKKFIVSNFSDVLDNFDKFFTIFKDAAEDFVFKNNPEDVFFDPSDYLIESSKTYKEFIW